MDRDEKRRILEVLLFVSDKPLSAETFSEIVHGAKPDEVAQLVNELNGEYGTTGRCFSVKEIAGGYQMSTDPVYSKWISELFKRPAEKLRGPALETLAIIAYKQPITRAEIEAIRGVNVDGVINTLEDRSLIKIKGRREGPGRPILYGTTNEFLIHFGLKSLDELPNLKEFKETDLDFLQERLKTDVVDVETGEVSTVHTGGVEPAATAPSAGAAAENEGQKVREEGGGDVTGSSAQAG